jgi:hypothetical protein
MKEIIEKLSSYNLFNYLLPGILFAIISSELNLFYFLRENIFEEVFLCYFLGLIISRVGSLLIEPILKKIAFIKFSGYNEFISASKKDTKLEILSEENNTYRTLSSMAFLLIIFKLFNQIKISINLSNDIQNYTLIILLLFLFLFSYRKQTNFINKRIEGSD